MYRMQNAFEDQYQLKECAELKLKRDMHKYKDTLTCQQPYEEL